ncbi:MAG: bifunctional riboflavin kinase/FAD synthetase [Bacteroidetes bacterium]|nr:bifunctional riboflavin kinase/FAD synthetase [Rhodothermia bacterium]MCS7154828.1 bifunctional riboflavin kinase/FAD synthetase [Bacteroidota bacterium]MCX7907014.1 bifunctional riboflavin kinase/FAD synthetase [Bacteroidota bacterium]MDW8137622.1 bifunctional riboflavin kinase/FAD synthetase [Bacteroidota bacterium]MDW8285424.1 bifunctional riboflavin kinase/FAD synthetase [Bacteroidota bacterium]
MTAPYIWLDELTESQPSVVTVGTFDGVHRGHQVILGRVRERARSLGLRSVALTFHPHPRQVLHPEVGPHRLLSTLSERAGLIRELGIDEVVVVRFTHEFAQMDSETFVRQMLLDRLGMRQMVVGYDHHFGRDRQGDPETLWRLSKRWGFHLEVIPPQQVHALTISSTQIRQALAQGDVLLAWELLGRPYWISGTVVPGRGRGRMLGFPTANLSIPPEKFLPAQGVYAVDVTLPNGASYRGMLNLGHRPTFGDSECVPEVHLLGFSGELYGEVLWVECLAHLRPVQRFPDAEALRRQLEADRARCAALRRDVLLHA